MNFDPTPIQVPKGWRSCELKDLLDRLESGLRPKGGVNSESGTIPSLGGENIKQEGGIVYFPVRKISERFYLQLKKGKLQDCDVLINKDGANTGKVGFYESRFYPEAAINEHVFLLRGKADALENRYLYYWLVSQSAQRIIQSRISSSAQPGLDSSFTKDFPATVPAALAEQEKIAAILATVDKLISKTEAFIVKLNRIKLGLMQDLLTRGIDEKGNVRSEKTHKFKDSLLGRIPEEWDVSSLDQLLVPRHNAMRSGPFGSALLKSELVIHGVPLLGIDNVHTERFVNKYTRFVTPKKANELRRYRVQPDDAMITIMGTVGRCCVAPKDIGVALSSKHVWTMTFDKSRYSPFLACLQFNYAPWVLQHFRRDEQGGIMSAIRSETLRTTRFPVPPIEEAKRIEDALVAISQEIGKEHLFVEKLQRLKSGLMEDLLTGKVRVSHPFKQ